MVLVHLFSPETLSPDTKILYSLGEQCLQIALLASSSPFDSMRAPRSYFTIALFSSILSNLIFEEKEEHPLTKRKANNTEKYSRFLIEC